MPLRVAIIEDHQALREGLQLLLSSRGVDVVGSAGTAREGLDLVAAVDPDVAVVDISLGDEDGIWLTRRLIEAHPGRAVVLYTGSADEDLLLTGMDSGARGYALKDGTPEELIEALQSVAGGGTYVDPRLCPALLSHRGTAGHPALSKREREIMDLLARGLTGEQVADRLFLSSETVKTHVRNAMNKLEASTRVHAIAIALREGHIAPPNRNGQLDIAPDAPPASGVRPAPSARV